MPEKRQAITEQLVIRIQGGDREAFDQLFMRYYPRIKLIVRLQMLDKLRAQVEAEDVIQEIYWEVYRNFEKFEYSDPESFLKWVSTVIGWKIKDFDKYYFKTAKRQHHETLSLQQRLGEAGGEAELGDSVPSSQSTPSQIMMEREGYATLEQAMARLPENFRTVITCRQILRLSSTETAERMGLRPNAVNVLFHRAQKRLQEVLEELSFFG